MKYNLIPIFLAIALMDVMGQIKPKVVEYFDKDWLATKDKERAVYYRTAEEYGGKYLVKDYYKASDSLQMEAICSSFVPKLIQEGKAIWYYKNGTIEREAVYKDNNPIGLQKRYYQNGTPQEVNIYRNKKELVCQYWSEDGKPLLLNGTGLIVKKEPLITLPIYIEVKDSVQISAYSIEPDKQDTVYLLTETPAAFQGGFEKFYKGIGSTLKYPKDARRHGIQGKVFVQFTVDQKGAVEGARVLKGIGGGCDEAALEACINQKGWSPAIVKGKPVKMRMVLPITFKLG
jgi:TonB family protein